MKDNEIDILMDIRSHPTSRWEQHRKENYEKTIPEAEIEYIWEPGLGGWDIRHSSLIDTMAKNGVNVAAYTKGAFPKQQISFDLKGVDGRPSWTNRGLYEYSWFMTLPEFTNAADKLIFMSKNKNIAIMCCEILYWKCHRSLVSDYLMFLGVDSTHLQPKRTLHSKALGNRLERYHPDIVKVWNSL